jgi:hypothetical protein
MREGHRACTASKVSPDFREMIMTNQALRCVLFMLIGLVSASNVRATTIDTNTVLTDPDLATGDDPTLRLNALSGAAADYTIVSNTFFYPDDQDSPVSFLRKSGNVWTNLLVTSTQTPIGAFSSYNCLFGSNNPFFTGCDISMSGNTVSFVFHGLDATHLGISDSGTKFGLQAFGFADAGDQCTTNGTYDPNRCWNANSTFTIQANVQANVPEPSTLLMMLPGLFGAVRFRRRRR